MQSGRSSNLHEVQSGCNLGETFLRYKRCNFKSAGWSAFSCPPCRRERTNGYRRTDKPIAAIFRRKSELGSPREDAPAAEAAYWHRLKRFIYSHTISQFPIRKGGIFRPGKEIEGLRGGVHGYAAQGSLKIDTARAEKAPFRTETSYLKEVTDLKSTPSRSSA
jgi:hypothetical protein